MGRAQLSLFDDKRVTQHGGEFSKGKRKSRRPFSTSKPIHLTLRASRAVGSLSLRSHRFAITKMAYALALQWGVRIYSLNVNGNHLHFVIKLSNRTYFQNFLRVFSGKVSMKVTGAKKGKPNKEGRFWDLLAWTRLAEWGKAFQTLKNYVLKNEMEVRGVIPYQPRKQSPELRMTLLRL